MLNFALNFGKNSAKIQPCFEFNEKFSPKIQPNFAFAEFYAKFRPKIQQNSAKFRPLRKI